MPRRKIVKQKKTPEQILGVLFLVVVVATGVIIWAYIQYLGMSNIVDHLIKP